MTPPELLDALLERAERLRAAGVVRVEMDGLSFQLAATPAPTYVLTSKDEERPLDDDGSPSDLDPELDPATYGLPPGSPIPGFRRPSRDDE